MHASTHLHQSKCHRVSSIRKFLFSYFHSHLHPAKANYSPHGNLAGSSHHKIRSVRQAIIPDESALLPLLATCIHLSVSLLITIFLQTEPDLLTTGFMCLRESIMTLKHCWNHRIILVFQSAHMHKHTFTLTLCLSLSHHIHCRQGGKAMSYCYLPFKLQTSISHRSTQIFKTEHHFKEQNQ